MLKLLKKYLIIVFFSVPVFRAETDNFKIFIPELVAIGKPFQVSLQTSKIFKEADRLNLSIIPGESILLTEAELWLPGEKKPLKISTVYNSEFGKSSHLVPVDLSSDYFSDKTSSFQVVLYFVAKNSTAGEFFISGKFLNDQNVLGYLENFSNENHTESENFFRFTLKPYLSNSAAGTCAIFSPNSSLIIPLNYKTDSKLLLEFLIKHQSYNNQVLRLVNRQSRRAEFSLELNVFQILRVNSAFHEQVFLKPGFISDNVWYCISIIIDTNEPYISFYCGAEEIAKFKMQYPADIEHLDLEFANIDSNRTFYLDQMRIINFKGDLIQVLHQSYYNEFLVDSSGLLSQINFSVNELNSNSNHSGITFSNIKMVSSDAPIFPRAPEINLKILNNYFEFTWTVEENANVSHYILEKAIGSGSFSEIARKIADDQENKTHSLITEKTDNSEIVYYRLKQVNKDKSVVFSDIVKIGLGLIEDVVLEQNYPNPFNPITQIKIELIQDGNIELKVFNLAGKEVALLHRGYLSKGIYKFEFNGSDLPTGIYLYQVTTALSKQTKKMILAK